MKFGILGTGMVGNTIGGKLIQLGHEVMIGSRTADNEKAKTFVATNGPKASHGTYTDAAKFGEVIFNCTPGGVSMDVLKQAGAENLKGKVLIDVSNPLDFSKGMPPTLFPNLCNTTSVAEEIQKAYPDTKVIKSLNTMNCMLMVNSSMLPGDHDVFVGGNDEGAKTKVKEILGWFGWKTPIDLGDIKSARGTEMILPLWVNLMGINKGPMFNFKVVK